MRKAKVCPRCGSVFMHRGNLNSHLKKKSECPAVYVKVNRNDIISDYETYYDMYMKLPNIEQVIEVYTPKKKLNQPIKPYKLRPKINKHNNDDLKNVIKNYFGNIDDNMMQVLTDDIIDIMQEQDIPQPSVTNNTVDNSNSINNSQVMQNSHNKQLNQQFNITVNAYGQEDLSHISQKDWVKIIKKKLDAIPELTKKIYIDEETNRNIYIKSFKDGYGLRFDGQHWKPVSMDKLMTDLVETNTDRLYDFIESEDTKVSSALYTSASDIIDKLAEDKSTLVKRNKMDIKELLIENNEMVLETSGKIKG
jgi:Zn-finger nucleic acid-binding protein